MKRPPLFNQNTKLWLMMVKCEIQENVKDLYKEIKENQKKIDEQKALEQKALLEESVKNFQI